MRFFWVRGYYSGGTRALLDEVGLGRQSLYNSFGDKATVYVKALRHYCRTVLDPLVDSLYVPRAEKRAIIEYFARRVDFLDTEDPRAGCLAVSAMTELTAPDRSLLIDVNSHFARLKRGFAGAIEQGRRVGTIRDGSDAAILADMFVCLSHGLAVSSKSGASRETMLSIVSAGLEPLY